MINNGDQQPNVIFHYTFGEMDCKNVLPPIEYNYQSCIPSNCFLTIDRYGWKRDNEMYRICYGWIWTLQFFTYPLVILGM